MCQFDALAFQPGDNQLSAKLRLDPLAVTIQ